MIKFDFKIDKDALDPKTILRNTLNHIEAIPNKEFTVTVGQNTYKIRYKVNGEFIDLYSDTNTSVTTPVIKLNIGDLLLPEFITLDTPYQPLDYTTVMEEGKGLSNNEIARIMPEINRIGLLKLIFDSQKQ